MKDVLLTVKSNKALTNDIYELILVGDISEIKYPGEFVEVKLPQYYLRRPFGAANFKDNELTILYKVLGHGTKDMTSLVAGDKLEVLIGLGNGFRDLAKKPLLLAGGIGLAPLIKLIEVYNEMGIKPTLVYGEQKASNFIYLDYLKEKTNLYLTTDDGSLGFKGNAVSFLKENSIDYDKYYACGPNPMLKAVKNYSENGYLSLEARMGCGFGACMGCSIKTTNGPKRVCKEGPVFEAGEVIYE